MKVYRIVRLNNDGNEEETGLVVFHSGTETAVEAYKVPENTLIADEEFSDADDWNRRTNLYAGYALETPDIVQGFREFFDLAVNRYGWEGEEMKWREWPAESGIARGRREDRKVKKLRKQKGFTSNL